MNVAQWDKDVMARAAGIIERVLTSRTYAVAMDLVLCVLHSDLLCQKGHRSFRCTVSGCKKCSVEVLEQNGLSSIPP